MCPPHRNNVQFLAAPQPNDRVKRPLDCGRAFPSVLVMPGCRLMNDWPSIKKQPRANKIEAAAVERL
jgi:hypothetical protein